MLNALSNGSSRLKSKSLRPIIRRGGASQIQSSIDQLLGYLTWRQSKAALILFVRSKNIDNVLVEISKQVKAHSYYVRENSIQSKGQLQYILHLESGKDNEIDLSVLVFHLPKT